MADEETPGSGFTIVDKRGGEDEATEAPETARTDPEGEPAPGTAASGAAPAAGTGIPPVDLPSFLISLGTSALFHLGLVPDPATGQPGEKNVELARHTIDTIALLEEKTKGNLAEGEAELFQHLLTELRMRFVEATS